MEKIVSYTITVGVVPNENNALDQYFEQGWRVKRATLLLDVPAKDIVVTVNLTKEISIQ